MSVPMFRGKCLLHFELKIQAVCCSETSVPTYQTARWHNSEDYNMNLQSCGKNKSYTCWLRHYATNRKVAGSIPDVVGFLNWPNPSSRTMALGSTQPLTENK
jgi:hypothetical protein